MEISEISYWLMLEMRLRLYDVLWFEHRLALLNHSFLLRIGNHDLTCKKNKREFKFL
jgi:hypothetical protein